MDVMFRIGTFVISLTSEGTWLNVQKVKHLCLQMKILQHSCENETTFQLEFSCMMCCCVALDVLLVCLLKVKYFAIFPYNELEHH